MKLVRAEIKNYRSIDELKFDFKYGCQALLGINESGKSNVLRALHLLDPDIPVIPADLRIERHDEAQITSGHVRFVFQLSKDETDEIFENLSELFATETIHLPVVAEGAKTQTLQEYCKRVNQGLYAVGIPSGSRSFSFWKRPDGESFASGWLENKSSQDLIVIANSGASITVPANGYVHSSVLAQFNSKDFTEANFENFATLHGNQIKSLVSGKNPKCIFWKYADQFLLPSSIEVSEFIKNPDSCIPLKSMFELAGYDAKKLEQTITQAKSQGHHRYSQILQKTGAKASEHIKRVWKDYKSVSIKLESHGQTLSPVVVDEDVPLDMANRSDGFKRFVSFLLQISAKVTTEQLKDTLILIDEPEIALHPSGARNLMNELIEIGETNLVVYSTHSIFMIDKNVIDRHILVEKKKEITSTTRAEKSRIQDEEVLYSAIGYSIFETLKQSNVIFEGWRDKELFRVVADAMSKTDASLKEKLSAIGMTFADGVKDVRNVAHLLQLASRPCLIISDADAPALQHQKMYRQGGAWGEWKTLSEILNTATIQTGEDLIKRSVVVKRANKFRTTINNLEPITEAFFNAGEPTVSGMKRWLATSGLVGPDLDAALNTLKGLLVESLKRTEISDEAEGIVTFVANYDFVEK